MRIFGYDGFFAQAARYLGGLTAHYENTLVVTKDGCEILTKL